MPSSVESSQPRDRTQVSRSARGFFLPSNPPGKPGSEEMVEQFGAVLGV